MQSFQQLSTDTTNQAPVQRQTSTIKSRQKPVQSKQGKQARHKAKQKPLQRNTKRLMGTENQLGEYQIKENVSQLMGTDVSDARVHYNSGKPAQLKAEATAQGNEVHLAPGKEQHLGHELTHVAQQKQGRVQADFQANNGVGINSDPKLEKEADDIGDKASKGDLTSSKPLQANTGGQTSSAPVQRYVMYNKRDQLRHLSEEDYNTTMANQKDADPYSEKMKQKYDKQTEKFEAKYKKREAKGKIPNKLKRQKEGWRHPKRKTLMVSNDGKMAVEGLGTYSKQAWADQSLITKANKVLAAKGSYVKLVTEANDLVVGNVPLTNESNPSKGSFKKIKAVHTEGGKDQNMANESSTEERKYGGFDKLKLRDCGNANRLIMGCIQSGAGGARRVYKSKDGSITVDTLDATKTIRDYILRIMQDKYPAKAYSDEEKAYNDYLSLSGTARAQVDKEYGLGSFARPDLGQGVTMVDANRYVNEKEAKANNTQSGETGYNYHFATNIMQSNDQGDYMALEGLADHKLWYFSMYGTGKGESFHERQLETVGDPEISTIVDKK
ncbi:hypothetical protein BKI52_24355 [marine bacterium AO1-C]|nr:hypothetical protein BKI52_24355 [marine bacterium AO1-C]